LIFEHNQKDRRAAISPKSDQAFGSGGCDNSGGLTIFEPATQTLPRAPSLTIALADPIPDHNIQDRNNPGHKRQPAAGNIRALRKLPAAHIHRQGPRHIRVAPDFV
jgi:hypothetical protein